MNRNILLFGLCVLLFGACGQKESKEGVKAPSYILRFNHVLTEQDPYQEAFLNWADRVAERTDNDLKIEVYHSAQLGVEEDIIEQMRQGSPIGQNSDAARLGNFVKELSVMNAPFFIENLEDVQKLIDSPTVQQWSKKLEDEYNIKIISFAYIQGYRHLLANKKGTSPSDLKSLAIRTAPAPIWVESIRSLGVTPVSLSYGEMYTGIQTKAVDGAELSYVAAYNTKVHEVVKYLMETGHIYQMNFSIVGKEWFDSLPKNYQTILIEEADKAGFEVSRKIEIMANEAKEKIRDSGVEIIERDQLDIKAFEEASIQAYQALGLEEARNAVYKDIRK